MQEGPSERKLDAMSLELGKAGRGVGGGGEAAGGSCQHIAEGKTSSLDKTSRGNG